MLVYVISPEKAAGKLQEREVPRVLNLEKEKSEHFKWIHLEQMQHCINLTLRVTFPAHIKLGKTGSG